MDIASILRSTDLGLYCAEGDFYIDPWKPVDRAVITHAHADHACRGSKRYLTAREGRFVLQARMGSEAVIDTLDPGESISINGVKVSLHPAGHILGSSQIRLEKAGFIAVVSGDYKVEPDATCASFEPVPCQLFVSESTFGLPIYRWPSQASVFDAIRSWWLGNQSAGKASLLFAYSLGKAQRLIAGVGNDLGPIYTHGAVEAMNRAYRETGIELPETEYAAVANKADWSRALIVAPPSAQGSPWIRRFGASSTAFASGWMSIRGARRRRSVDRGFVLSDHVDWPSLISSIDATGAEKIWITHGYSAVVARWLQEQGRDAAIISTRFEGERDDSPPEAGFEPEGSEDGMLFTTKDDREEAPWKAFADLYTKLDETAKTTEKVEALTEYFRSAPAADAAWAVYFLIGRKPKQVVKSGRLRAWAAMDAGIPDWLFQECYDAAGDVAETIALVLPEPSASTDRPLSRWVEDVLLPLRKLDEEAQSQIVRGAWNAMDRSQRFVWNKLISGGFRVGVSEQLVTRAIGKVNGVDPNVIAHRLMGEWEPTPTFFEELRRSEAGESAISRPYPFFLAHAVEGLPEESLGDVSDWEAEWKWDGIRSQLIRRAGETFLWSRGEELVTERYPEIASVGDALPDGTVIDGEILPFKDGLPLPFALLQRRIGRKAVGKTILTEIPVILMAYDLLEWAGEDIRSHPLEWRRERLAELVRQVDRPLRFQLSPRVEASSWAAMAEARTSSREAVSEGLMLKRRGSAYGVGRRKGDWWKWKVNPFTIDAVLTAAQRGSGKRASLYTDYTFGLWDGDKLVTVAKAYSGLTDAEIRRVDSFVRRNMVEKFGPVRTVKPELVFELAFEGLNRSPRHKSGVAVRFPRILRWREDKPASEADNLDTLQSLLPLGG